MSIKRLFPSVLLVAMSACAAKTVTPGAADEMPAGPVNRDRNLLTQGEIDANPSLKAASVLDMLKSLRPQYFTERGTQTVVDKNAPSSQDPEAGKVHASVNGGRVISISDLEQIHGNEVLEVRFLSIAQANLRFGTAARSGPIILVMTVKQ